jgi:hypothetical protein
MSARPLWLALLLLACASCAWKVPRVGELGPRLADEEQEKAYQALDTRFFVHATYQAWPFREARVRRAAAFRSLPAPAVEQQLQREREAHAAGHEIFLAMSFSHPKHDDFQRGEKSIWRLALVTDRGEVTPARIERIGRSTLDARSLYPYFDEFWVGYRLTFPLAFADGSKVVPEGAETVTLRVASSLGSADLKFPAR